MLGIQSIQSIQSKTFIYMKITGLLELSPGLLDALQSFISAEIPAYMIH
jgi:hypothetical protein